IPSAKDGKRGDLRSQLQCKASIELPSRLGIADQSAAISIDLSQSNGNFAMIEGAKDYHRPWCSLTQEWNDLKFSLHPHLRNDKEERRECEQCKPDRWDLEADMGEELCLGPKR